MYTVHLGFPAIMGTVLIVAGLALVGVSTWSRAEGSEKTTQAGALIIGDN